MIESASFFKVIDYNYKVISKINLNDTPFSMTFVYTDNDIETKKQLWKN